MIMAAQKPLYQLLQEDQEPFLLHNYIADRRYQLKKPTLKTHLQLKKRKPISHNFCKNVCFFSINNSPDLRQSPLFEFQSPAKSPCKTPNTVFLHVPAKTAALLLEAALRIQKQSSTPSSKPKINNGFSLFGSLLKRITHRSKTRKREISGGDAIKDIVSRRKLFGKRESKREEEIMVNVDEKSGFSCSCNGRPSSAVWSESNEDKSWDLDLETSSSGLSDHEEEFVKQLIDVNGICDFAFYDNHFCESPFHFMLRRSPSSGYRTPAFSSPATSPSRRNIEGKEYNEGKKFQVQKEKEEEEDKEQCSPVSVLDPPFEDNDDGHDDHSEDDGFDLECSYAIVQRAKQQLLQKLRRFEKLAELDPVELEKRMQEQEQEYEDGVYQEEEDCELSEKEQDIDELIMEQLSKSSFCRTKKILADMNSLVRDLIKEEEGEESCYFPDRVSTIKRVCNRLEGWKEVESNTIDMMVEQDFNKQVDEWKRYQEQVGEAALEIEFAIFQLLLEELSQELAA